jgi:hypothetical protein
MAMLVLPDIFESPNGVHGSGQLPEVFDAIQFATAFPRAAR